MLFIIHGGVILEKSDNEICKNNFLWCMGIVKRQFLSLLDTTFSLYLPFASFPFCCTKFSIVVFTKPNVFIIQNFLFIFPSLLIP